MRPVEVSTFRFFLRQQPRNRCLKLQLDDGTTIKRLLDQADPVGEAHLEAGSDFFEIETPHGTVPDRSDLFAGIRPTHYFAYKMKPSAVAVPA